MFTLKTKRNALRKLAKISNNQKQKIREILLTLKNDPIPFKKADVCKLNILTYFCLNFLQVQFSLQTHAPLNFHPH
jgi:hypothetical protein